MIGIFVVVLAMTCILFITIHCCLRMIMLRCELCAAVIVRNIRPYSSSTGDCFTRSHPTLLSHATA